MNGHVCSETTKKSVGATVKIASCLEQADVGFNRKNRNYVVWLSCLPVFEELENMAQE